MSTAERINLSDLIQEYTRVLEEKKSRFSSYNVEESKAKEALRKKHMLESKLLYLKYFGPAAQTAIANALKDGRSETIVHVPECLWLSPWNEPSIDVGDEISIDNPLHSIKNSFDEQGYKVYFLSHKTEEDQYDWSKLVVSWYKK